MKTLKRLGWVGVLVVLGAGCGKEPLKGVLPEDALNRLMEGNRRYVSSKATHPDQTAERRTAVAGAQSPFAVVLGCADSRVPPEVLFDQGLGDLFVVRTAGHVVDEAGLGSLEYAVEHLGVHLIVVLGHERCGAVGAAVKDLKTGGHVDSLVKAIRPAVEASKGMPGDPLDNAMRANVAMVTRKLKASKPILAGAVEEHKVRVVGARYDLDSGAVEVIAP